jgi:HTH-type transcriptional regulator, competence development regulator
MKDEKKEILEKFGAYVKQVRNDKGLTMLEVEVITGISEGSISKIENGKKNPALTTIIKLAKGLSVPPSELLTLFDK